MALRHISSNKMMIDLVTVRKCPKFLISIDSFLCKEYYIEYF